MKELLAPAQLLRSVDEPSGDVGNSTAVLKIFLHEPLDGDLGTDRLYPALVGNSQLVFTCQNILLLTRSQMKVDSQ